LNSADVHLATMTRQPWGSIEAVEDESPYVKLIKPELYVNIPTIRNAISETKYFRRFCEIFAE